MGWDDTFLRFKIEPDSSLFPTDNATSANDEENVEEVEEEKKKKKRTKFLWIF
jgi:hypothetical protein